MPLHKLIDTVSGQEILSDDKWLPVYKSRAGVEYIGEVEETTSEQVTDQSPTPKRKKKDA